MSNEKIETEILIELDHLNGRPIKLSNIEISANRDDRILSDSKCEQLIEAISKSETSTLGYAAASFAPILLLMNSLEFLKNASDPIVIWIVIFICAVLGFSGVYFFCYKAMFLGPRRILLEGYRTGLIHSFKINLLPRGIWEKVNFSSLISMTLGYIAVFALIMRVLLT